MEAKILELICTKSKAGQSLRQIAELTELSIDQVKEKLGQATGLSSEELDIIFNMKQRGLTLEQINQEFGVGLEVLKQFLPIRETVGTQIDALADQDQGPCEISLGERAYTPGSDCKSYSRSAPTTTE
jgi:lambda repressor-like predicted transcriptional regulator